MLRSVTLRTIFSNKNRYLTTFGKSQLKSQSLANGIKAITIEPEFDSPISTLTMMIKAGSRYEDVIGISHYLKCFAFQVLIYFFIYLFQGTKNKTALGISRTADLLGAMLTTKNTKEHVILEAKCLKEDL